MNKNLTALSNTPIISEELSHETFFNEISSEFSTEQQERHEPELKKKIVFDWTPSMCTYLLCFIAGYFEYLERHIDHTYT